MTINPPPYLPKNCSKSSSDVMEPELGYLREYLGNRLVYTIVSPRAGGLCVGINMNPDKYCNFKCDYCEVGLRSPASPTPLDINLMIDELRRMLTLVNSDKLNNFYAYRNIPEDLMRLRHVALSGDGEPTLCPNFLEVIQAIVHVRALGSFPYFKIALLTNASGLDLRQVQEGLRLLTRDDEIWVKLEAGSQHYFEEVSGANCHLDKILENILLVGRGRPIVIQSLFPLLNHCEPSPEEIELYAQRLNDLKRAGAQISLVQIYSATRPPANPKCGHLPLKTLVKIAKRVSEVSGLKTQVF